MTTITTTNNLVTLNNVFTVELEDQQRLVDILVKAGEAKSKKPGFIESEHSQKFRWHAGDKPLRSLRAL